MHRIEHRIEWLKLTAWTMFAVVGPGTFAAMHNYLGMTVTGAVAIAIGLLAFPAAVVFTGRRALRIVLVAQGLVLGGYGAWMLSRPDAPWVRVAGHTRVSLALDPDTGTVYAAEFTEHKPGFFVRQGGAWTREALPGPLVLRIALDRDGTVLAHEDRAPNLWLRAATGRWRRVPGQAQTPRYAASTHGLLAATRAPLRRLATADAAGVVVEAVGEVTAVCSLGAAVLAVRSADTGDGRVWRSDDGGAHFDAVPGASLRGSLCGLSHDGWAWIADEGLFSGDLAVAAPGASFASRPLPAPRIEALVVDPDHGQRAWIGAWGAGVFSTEDGGERWTPMGLAGSEVSALVVDFRRRVAYAGTGSGVLELGL